MTRDAVTFTANVSMRSMGLAGTLTLCTSYLQGQPAQHFVCIHRPRTKKPGATNARIIQRKDLNKGHGEIADPHGDSTSARDLPTCAASTRSGTSARDTVGTGEAVRAACV